MIELALLSLLGGVLALDATSVGQFMVSRPLVAGLLGGALLGAPGAGLAVGALLELYLLVSFPTGGARFPEGATATLVAVAGASAAGGVGALPVGVAVGLIWGQVGGFTVTALRHLTAEHVPEPGSDAAAGPRAVASFHRRAMALDFARGVVVTGLGALLAGAAVRALAPAWPLSGADATGLLLVGAAASAGIFLRSLGGFRKRPVVFLAGLLAGLLGGRLL